MATLIMLRRLQQHFVVSGSSRAIWRGAIQIPAHSFFVDRKKDAVRFAGRNISTLEVESVVLRHPDIGEAAAFGIPTEALQSDDELKINVVPDRGRNTSAGRYMHVYQ